MSLSTSLRMKIWYDNAAGVLVDITLKILTMNDIDIQGQNENVRPFGVGMDQFLQSGIGHIEPIELGGLLQTTGLEELDSLFGDRIPEDPDTGTRTFKVDWIGNNARTTEFETTLLSYKRSANKENGLTKVMIRLQPTGEVIETGLDT